MAKVNWTFQSLEDIDDIAEFHSQSSPQYASFLVDEFFESPKQLESFPFSGRVVPELNVTSIRELIVRRYRIIYAVVDEKEINILTVRLSSRPLGSIPS